MSEILTNRTYRDGSGLVIRLENDGTVQAIIIGPNGTFTTELTDVPRADHLVVLMQRYLESRSR